MKRNPWHDRDYDPLFVELRDYFFMFIVICMILIVAAIVFVPSRTEYPIRTAPIPTVTPSSLVIGTAPR